MLHICTGLGHMCLNIYLCIMLYPTLEVIHSLGQGSPNSGPRPTTGPRPIWNWVTWVAGQSMRAHERAGPLLMQVELHACVPARCSHGPVLLSLPPARLSTQKLGTPGLGYLTKLKLTWGKLHVNCWRYKYIVICSSAPHDLWTIWSSNGR